MSWLFNGVPYTKCRCEDFRPNWASVSFMYQYQMFVASVQKEVFSLIMILNSQKWKIYIWITYFPNRIYTCTMFIWNVNLWAQLLYIGPVIRNLITSVFVFKMNANNQNIIEITSHKFVWIIMTLVFKCS